MALRNLIILSLFLLPLSLGAESASDYIHRGAQKYIFGHEEAAESEVKEGLTKFPNDKELHEMLALFKKKPPQNQQNDQKEKNNKDQKQNQDQNRQQQNSNGSQGDNEKNQSTPTPSPGEQSPTPTATPGSSPPDNQEAGESPTPSPGSGNQNGNENGEHPTPSPFGTPRKPLTGEVKAAGEQKPEGTPNAELAEAEPEKEGEMTPKQAKALLESMKDEEEKVQLDEHKAVHPVYKDW
jgi:hypothetical protein